MLLSEELIEIDKLTIKGTALHIASSTNKRNFVTLLLSKKANTMIKDFEENTPFDVTTSLEIQDMIQTVRRRKTEIFVPVLLFFVIFDLIKNNYRKKWMNQILCPPILP